MKAKFTRATMVKIVLIAALFSTIFACRKDFSHPGNSPAGNLKTADNNLISTSGNPTPVYNLNVFLNNLTQNPPGSGFINFHHNPYTSRIITLATSLTHL